MSSTKQSILNKEYPWKKPAELTKAILARISTYIFACLHEGYISHIS